MYIIYRRAKKGTYLHKLMNVFNIVKWNVRENHMEYRGNQSILRIYPNPNGLILGLTIEEVFGKVCSCLYVDLKLSRDKGKL